MPVYVELEQLWWRLLCDTFTDPKKSFDYWNLLFEHIFILACATFISDFSLGSPGQQGSLGADISRIPGDQKDVVNSVPMNWGTWVEWGLKWGGILWGPTLGWMLEAATVHKAFNLLGNEISVHKFYLNSTFDHRPLRSVWSGALFSEECHHGNYCSFSVRRLLISWANSGLGNLLSMIYFLSFADFKSNSNEQCKE